MDEFFSEKLKQVNKKKQARKKDEMLSEASPVLKWLHFTLKRFNFLLFRRKNSTY